MPQSSLLSDFIDLHAALQADRAIDPDRKKQRDRKIGTLLRREKDRPASQLRGWLAGVDISDWRRDGHTGTQLYHGLGLLLALLGLVAGWSLAEMVLHYTGDAPINIINVLAVLILPQLVLLLFWCMTAVPARLPLISNLQSALRFLNPGRLPRGLTQRFPFVAARRLEVVWDPENIGLASTARWLFSFWSQLFSVSFNVGALLAVFYLILSSDLAFGWSTTLAVDNATFHSIVNTLSLPWCGFLPEAVPGIALVEASRFYRLETGAFGNDATAQQAALLGAWWPFLVSAIVCYGLLPRLITLLVSWQRFHHHLRHALVRLPGATELLARMNSPLVSTAAPMPEPAPVAGAGVIPPRKQVANDMIRCSLVAWSGSVTHSDDVRRRLPDIGIEPLDLRHAGGAQSTEQDQSTIAELCRQRDQGVAIIVKAWEPPLLEFVDFVQQVRSRCMQGQPLIVLLWGGEAPVSDSDAGVWSLTLRQLQDPNLYVEAIR